MADLNALREQNEENAKKFKGKLSHQADGVAGLLKVEKPALLRTVTVHAKKVYGVNWLNDSKHIVSCGQEGNVIITDATLNVIACPKIKSKFVMSCAAWTEPGWSNDQSVLVAEAGMNNVVSLWRKDKGAAEFLKVKDMEGHEGYIGGLNFLKGGKQLISGSGDGFVKIWDTEKKTCITTFMGHEQDVSGVTILGPDENIFGTSSTDKTVRVWDMRQKCAIRMFKTKYGANCCAMMPNNAGIMAGCDSASWEFFDIGSNNQVARGKVKTGRCESIAISSSGRFVYMGWDDGKMTIADAYIPDNQYAIAAGDMTVGKKGSHTQSVCSMSVAPDGAALLTSSFDSTAKVWGKKE